MGHANSTRRIAAEGGAFDKVRPPTPPVPRSLPAPVAAPSTPPSTPPPAPTPLAPSRAIYTVPFEATLMNENGKAPSAKRTAFAQGVLEDANWGEYVLSIMRDSVPNNPNREYVELEDHDVTITSCAAKYVEGFGDCVVFTGVLTWISVGGCPLEEVQRNVNWFIGDRMSMYEIEYENWHVYIDPGKVSVA